MSTVVNISIEEFIARPDREDDQREELIEGEIIVSPSAKFWHAVIVVVEVAFPSNRTLQRKAVPYLEHGAEQVWLVYRKTRTVTVLTPDGTTEARMGESLEFHGVQVPVDSIFIRSE